MRAYRNRAIEGRQDGRIRGKRGLENGSVLRQYLHSRLHQTPNWFFPVLQTFLSTSARIVFRLTMSWKRAEAASDIWRLQSSSKWAAGSAVRAESPVDQRVWVQGIDRHLLTVSEQVCLSVTSWLASALVPDLDIRRFWSLPALGLALIIQSHSPAVREARCTIA